jgi:hypothetical protein
MFMGAVKEGLHHVAGMQKATVAEIREMSRSMQTKEGCEAQRAVLKSTIDQDIQATKDSISTTHAKQQDACQQAWDTTVERMKRASDKAREAAENAETAAKLFRKNGRSHPNWTAIASLGLALLMAGAAFFMWLSNREVERALTEESVKGLQQEVKELKDTIQTATRNGHSYLFRPPPPKTWVSQQEPG